MFSAFKILDTEGTSNELIINTSKCQLFSPDIDILNQFNANIPCSSIPNLKSLEHQLKVLNTVQNILRGKKRERKLNTFFTILFNCVTLRYPSCCFVMQVITLGSFYSSLCSSSIILIRLFFIVLKNVQALSLHNQLQSKFNLHYGIVA